MRAGFAVVTRIALPSTGGNLCCPVPIFIEHGTYGDPGHYFEPTILPMFRVQLFYLGEILIIDEDTREIAPPGRKLSKWDVSYDLFNSLDSAIKRSMSIIKVEGDSDL